MSNVKNPARVVISGRLAFPILNEPEKFQGTGKPRFSSNIIFDKGGADEKKVMAAMMAAATKQWGQKAEAALKALRAGNKTALVDGDSKSDVAGYEGNWVVAAHAKDTAPPRLVISRNGKNETLDRETQTVFYAGCYVNAIIEFWSQDNQYGKRINAQLAGLQFVKHGEPFGGGRPAADDEFEVVDVADEDGFDLGGNEDDSPFI